MLARRVMLRSVAVVLAAGLAAACSSGDNDDNAAAADSLVADTAPAAAPAPAGALTDAQIARIVMLANTADSAGGETAQSKGSSAEVRGFGQRMVQDHGGANQQAQQLVQRLGVTPEESDMSRQLQAGADSASQALQAQSGAAFDRAYIDHEVQLHQMLLDALDQQLIPAAQNPELKQLLQNVRTAVDSHLQQARQIQSRTGGQPAGG